MKLVKICWRQQGILRNSVLGGCCTESGCFTSLPTQLPLQSSEKKIFCSTVHLYCCDAVTYVLHGQSSHYTLYACYSCHLSLVPAAFYIKYSKATTSVQAKTVSKASEGHSISALNTQKRVELSTAQMPPHQ